MFLFLIEQNVDLFAWVRSWILDRQYWAIEEPHFMQINSLILDYRTAHGGGPSFGICRNALL